VFNEKEETVNPVTEGNYAFTEAGKSLGANPNLISRWKMGSDRWSHRIKPRSDGVDEVGTQATAKREQTSYARLNRFGSRTLEYCFRYMSYKSDFINLL